MQMFEKIKHFQLVFKIFKILLISIYFIPRTYLNFKHNAIKSPFKIRVNVMSVAHAYIMHEKGHTKQEGRLIPLFLWEAGPREGGA